MAPEQAEGKGITAMEGLLDSAVRLGTLLLFLAVGELVAERAGILNLGIEGLLLVTALTAAIGAEANGPVFGTLLAAVVGIVFCTVVGLLVITLHVDQIVTGLALNIAALGGTTFVFRSSFEGGQTFDRLDTISVPVVGDVAYLRLLFEQTPLFYVLIGLVALSGYLLYVTRLGLRIRATGDAPGAVDAEGLNVARTRYQALVFAGCAGGLGGAYLVLSQTGRFTENMSGGRGFIAIAAVVFGGWRLRGVIGAAAVFGLGSALQFELPALGVEVPNQLLLALPYVVALIAITLLPQRGATPAALMRPFSRGER